MTFNQFLLALSIAALASGATAATENKDVAASTPAKADKMLYCIKVAPMTGSRVSTTECKTKSEWARDGVEVSRPAK